MKVCLIKQPAGLGDILYTLKIAKSMVDKGFQVIWPVIKEYSFISRYIRDNNITFIDETAWFPYKSIYQHGAPVQPTKDFIFLPLQTADRLYPNISIIESKYALAGLTHDNWQDSVRIRRNAGKEGELFYEALSLSDGEEYIFVNSLYGSPPNSVNLQGIRHPDDNRVINLSYLEGFNPFDWSKVIEEASAIYTVDTCFVSIIEKLAIKTDVLHMYSRREFSDFIYQIKPYFSRNWSYEDKSIKED